MDRFYIDAGQIQENSAILDAAEARHLLKVRRLKKGSEAVLFDGQGKEYYGTVKDILFAPQSGRSDKNVLVEINSVKTAEKDTKVEVTLACVVPKNNRLDLIIQKATELGIAEIIPVISSRSVVKPTDEKSRQNHHQRWGKIIIEAGKQCGRCFLPGLSDIKDIKEVLPLASGFDLALFAALDTETVELKQVFSRLRETCKDPEKIPRVICFIGPEGDFAPEEVQAAKEYSWHIVSLGRLVLKVDTAALYLMSVLKYEFE